MARKTVLESAYEPIGLLVGITTTLRDYRVAYFLNKLLEIDLKAIADLPVYHEKLQQIVRFPLFWHHHRHLRTDYFLIANNNGGMLMMPTLKNFNYFLILKGAAPDDQFNDLPRMLRDIPEIQAAFPIVPETVKNIANILSDLELHMIDVIKNT